MPRPPHPPSLFVQWQKAGSLRYNLVSACDSWSVKATKTITSRNCFIFRRYEDKWQARVNDTMLIPVVTAAPRRIFSLLCFALWTKLKCCTWVGLSCFQCCFVSVQLQFSMWSYQNSIISQSRSLTAQVYFGQMGFTQEHSKIKKKNVVGYTFSQMRERLAWVVSLCSVCQDTSSKILWPQADLKAM